MNIFVTGGKEYLGSVVVEALCEQGWRTTTYDAPSEAKRAVYVPAGVQQLTGSLSDATQLAAALAATQADAVLHLAAVHSASAWRAQPAALYRANLTDGLALLAAMQQVGVTRLVSASTCAVYGAPVTMPISEATPTVPLHAAGAAQLAFEQALPWYETSYGLRAIVLRCFNLAGATERNGDADSASPRLIPQILRVATGQAEAVEIYGENYATPDRTCIRDYLHVRDAAAAHLLALTALQSAQPLPATVFNLGYGSGYSVAEVVELARQLTGLPIPTEAAPRRAGDAPTLIANADQAMRDLGWQARQSELDNILATAWAHYEATAVAS